MTPKTMTGRRVKAYTSRKIPVDFIDRMRVLAAMRSATEQRRVTLEQVVNDVIRRGLPLVEREVLK